MADEIPRVQTLSEEDRERIRQEFGIIKKEVDAEQAGETPRKRRGRPPGSKNKIKPKDFSPVKEDVDNDIFQPVPLSTRDQNEVAKRLQGILTGISGVASVAKPYLQMSDEEAEAIATPLTSYLIRTEATSGIARQVLSEYDIAAFVIASLAYLVRIYNDMGVERKQNAERNESAKQREAARKLADANRLNVPNGSADDQRESRDERPVDRQLASSIGYIRSPSEV